jgi:threonyl-tRNA synthetase
MCLLCGAGVQAEGTVNVRTRDNVVHGMRKLSEVKQLLTQERDSRSLDSAFGSKPADGGQQPQQQAAAAAPDS